MKKGPKCLYRVIAYQWWTGEVKPGGKCYSNKWLARTQKEARETFLKYTGWLHDDRTVKITCCVQRVK